MILIIIKTKKNQKKNEYIKQQIDSFNSFENKRKKIFESLIYNNEKNEDKKNKKKEYKAFPSYSQSIIFFNKSLFI